MKNLIVAFSIVLAAGTAPAYAHTASSEPYAKEVFAKKFSGAENIKWTSLNDGYQKVAFTLVGTRAEAYFDADGELLGTIRNLFYNQLPLAVIQSLSSNYPGAIFVEIKEISNADGTSYKVTLEYKDRRYAVKMNMSGDVTDQQKWKIKK